MRRTVEGRGGVARGPLIRYCRASTYSRTELLWFGVKVQTPHRAVKTGLPWRLEPSAGGRDETALWEHGELQPPLLEITLIP